MAKRSKKKKKVSEIIDEQICPGCESPICGHVLDQMRLMENANIVLGQAVKSLEAIIAKRDKMLAILRIENEQLSIKLRQHIKSTGGVTRQGV